MRRFVFRLARLRRLRQSQEQSVLLDLAQVYSLLAQVDSEKASLRVRLRESNHEALPHEALGRWRDRLVYECDRLAAEEETLCRRAAELLARLERVRGRLRALERLEERRSKVHMRRKRGAEDRERELYARGRLGPSTL